MRRAPTLSGDSSPGRSIGGMTPASSSESFVSGTESEPTEAETAAGSARAARRFIRRQGTVLEEEEGQADKLNEALLVTTDDESMD